MILFFAIHRGGWPSAIIMKDRTSAMSLSTEYIEQVIESDVSRVDNVEKNPNRVRNLLRFYARNISTVASLKTIQDDIITISSGLSDHAIAQYLNAPSRIFVIRDIPAWQPSLRSKTAIRTTPKRQFIDHSLATAIMRLSPSRFFDDIKYYGLLFESLVERDLRIYAELNDGNLYHYRDANGLEIDSVVELNDGR